MNRMRNFLSTHNQLGLHCKATARLFRLTLVSNFVQEIDYNLGFVDRLTVEMLAYSVGQLIFALSLVLFLADHTW